MDLNPLNDTAFTFEDVDDLKDVLIDTEFMPSKYYPLHSLINDCPYEYLNVWNS